jgi:hypothetical protein
MKKQINLFPKTLNQELLSIKHQEIQEENFEMGMKNIPIEDLLNFDFSEKKGFENYIKYLKQKLNKKTQTNDSEKNISHLKMNMIRSISMNYDGSLVYFYNSNSKHIYSVNTMNEILGRKTYFLI